MADDTALAILRSIASCADLRGLSPGESEIAENGMTIANLVKVTTFLSSREYVVANRDGRQQALGAHTPALTVIIAAIFDESWLLEIEAVAAA
ncbi:MAG: RidA family protein [Devosia sp.]